MAAWMQGVQADAALAHGGLAELLTALRSYRHNQAADDAALLRRSIAEHHSWLAPRVTE
jgi:hypothetical protein